MCKTEKGRSLISTQFFYLYLLKKCITIFDTALDIVLAEIVKIIITYILQIVKSISDYNEEQKKNKKGIRFVALVLAN